MMFRRRHRPPLHKRVAGLVWPRRGWRRAGAYLGHRLRRLPGSPDAIAAGFACGVAVSFTPFIGFHFILGALIAWLMRGNILASALGTAVGNPWTFPFIWIATFRTGSFVLGDSGLAPVEPLTMERIFDQPLSLLLPMGIGSIPFVIVSWLVAFWLVRRAVARYQGRRRLKLQRRMAASGIGAASEDSSVSDQQ